MDRSDVALSAGLSAAVLLAGPSEEKEAPSWDI